MCVLYHIWQDCSLGSLIDETETTFKTREEEYQATIGQIEVTITTIFLFVVSLEICLSIAFHGI